ncbi:MAG: nicotinate (nicotinamide) nucleotide adenylyltransferase [Lentimicrobiaceae bacterium]|nr:nicotinate (nicotinamide) nucleotide adenylyltransferase [Lentimicrobiaceae bacterium]
MKIGLFFGSFNPVHNGHLFIAHFLKQKRFFNEIWLVVSPNNPFKNKEELAPQNHRLNMVKLAIKDYPYLIACDAEFSLPIPSYTINTLNYLEKQHPNNKFSLILGADNIKNFHQWKDYEEILKRFTIYVYPRSNDSLENLPQHPHIIYIDAPLLPISATEIRSLWFQKKTLTEYLPDSVVKYIKKVAPDFFSP